MKPRTRAGERVLSCAALVGFLIAGHAARGDVPSAKAPRRAIVIGAELGYAFPLGALERGSELADVVHGLVPLGIEGGYHFTTRASLVAYAHYAKGIPTLCATASDCFASLGHDIAVGVGGRFLLPRVGPVGPEIRAVFGYEWFRSELSDHGVTSGRMYRGPLLTTVQAFGNVGSDERAVGPFVAMSAGIFSHRSLETPAFETSSFVDRAALHLWLEVGLRGAWSL